LASRTAARNPEISVFLLGKKIGERPAWQEIASKGMAAKFTGFIGIL